MWCSRYLLNGGKEEEMDWEDALPIKDQYPDFNLEDKVNHQAAGNVREWTVYEWRRKN